MLSEATVSSSSSVTFIIVPHGKKLAVRDLPAGHDPADPGLTPAAIEQATALNTQLDSVYGAPTVIGVSTKLRAIQTAETAIKLHVGNPKRGALLMALSILGQPDSGDVDPTHPQADVNGHVLYGERSTIAEWHSWALNSFRMLYLAHAHIARPGGHVRVYTHRPFAAMGRWFAQHGIEERNMPKIENGEALALDTSLLPYIVLKVEDEGRIYTELPRPT